MSQFNIYNYQKKLSLPQILQTSFAKLTKHWKISSYHAWVAVHPAAATCHTPRHPEDDGDFFNKDSIFVMLMTMSIHWIVSSQCAASWAWASIVVIGPHVEEDMRTRVVMMTSTSPIGNPIVVSKLPVCLAGLLSLTRTSWKRVFDDGDL